MNVGRGRRRGEYISAIHMQQSISYIMLLEVYPAKPDPDPDIAGSRSG